MEIVLVGLNHRTAPLELRERTAFSSEEAVQAARELRSRGILEETLVLSTCNRSEVYGVPPEAVRNGAGAIADYLAAFHHLSPAELNGCLYRHGGSDAVRHLFRVAAGLDSMLLGEAEILGQVREAYLAAHEQGATGPVLNRMFQAALEVGKRVRSETDIGTRPVSVAFAGVKLAEKIFGSLRGHRALILGAGAVGEQVVEHMRNRGISKIFVANRSRERAEELAHRVEGSVVPWEGMSRALGVPEVIVSSVGAAEPVLTRTMIEQAMATRENRVLFLIDLGVPRNVEAEVRKLYNVYLYNIDDLSEIVEQNRKARASEVPRADAIIEEHVAKFEAWQASVQVVVVLKQLREKLGGQSRKFLRQRLEAAPHLSAEERERIAKLAEELLEEVIVQPVEGLRRSRELRRKLQNLEAVRDLFGLGEEKP